MIKEAGFYYHSSLSATFCIKVIKIKHIPNKTYIETKVEWYNKATGELIDILTTTKYGLPLIFKIKRPQDWILFKRK